MAHVRGLKKLCGAAIIAALMVIASPQRSTGTAATTSDVVILYSFRKDSPGIALLDQKIRATLAARSALEYHAEYMDVPIFDEEDQSRLLSQYLEEKYQHRKVDVFIAYGNPAIRFLLAHRSTVFPDSRPLFFAAQDGEMLQELRKRDISGSYFSYEIVKSLETALKLRPATRQVFVIAGSAPEDQPPIVMVQQAEKEFKEKLTFTYLTNLTVEATLDRIRNLPENSIVLYTTFARDSNGVGFLPVNVAAKVAAAANVPVFGVVDSFLGTGILGGWMYNTDANGELIARLTLSALDGTLALDGTEILPAVSIPMFDQRVLAKWKIPQEALPAGNIVRFKSPGMWELYKWSVTLVLGVSTVLILSVGILIVERGRRRKQIELRLMSERVLKVQDEERRRLARELHDGTTQNVLAIGMNLASLQRSENHTSVNEKRLADCRTLCERSLEELRTISYRLHAPELDRMGFESAVRLYAEGISKRSGIQVEVDIDKTVGRIPSYVEPDFYRIIQESLTNILRHSGSSTAVIRVSRESENLILQVKDFGKGMPKAAAAVATGGTNVVGVGIQGMRERVRYLHGQFDIESGSDGTTVTVTVPDGLS